MRELGLVAITIGALACAGPAHAGPSNFQRSCNDIRIERPAGDVSIGATCRDRSGRTGPADFDLHGYHNVDGRLTFDGRGKSTFQRSCDGIDIRVSPERVLLVAECRDRNQNVRKTTIEIQDIQNIDGRLTRIVASAQPAQNVGIDLNLRWSGNWVWRKTGQSNNISTFEMLKNNTASYCYDRDCQTVRYQFKDGVLRFSKNGKDHFEFRPTNGGEVVFAKYWFDRKDRDDAPVATARFNKAGR
ncbi:MAG: CVNH domain-containing protein [Pseudorhodoplanes sp.]|uniref:mannose-binding lectin n=1 Tax=Pseudorhodoplanes sp. TaxID=1934341 RepID=UPI003D12EA1B